MMPLTFADNDAVNIIRRVGGSPEVKKHLENLGFVVGGNVQVISRLGGNVIVNVKESRIAISEEMARKIMIGPFLITSYVFKQLGGNRMKTLREVPIGSTVKVVKIHGEGAVRRRIMDMGLTKGVDVTVRKVAPLGDPIQLNVRGYELSIRKADAEMVEVE